MSWLSQLKNFVFNPVQAAAARAQVSTNPATAAMGDEAVKALSTVPLTAGASVGVAVATGVAGAASTVAAGINSHKSAVGIINDVVGEAETALKVAVDAYALATVGALPIVGGFLAPEAVKIANAAMDFGTQHFMTYLAAMFSHHSAAINAPQPVAVAQPVQPPQPGA